MQTGLKSPIKKLSCGSLYSRLLGFCLYLTASGGWLSAAVLSSDSTEVPKVELDELGRSLFSDYLYRAGVVQSSQIPVEVLNKLKRVSDAVFAEDLAEAETLLRSLNEAYPDHPLLLERGVMLYVMMGNNNEAGRHLKKLQEIAAEAPYIGLLKVRTFLLQGKFPDALQLMPKVYQRMFALLNSAMPGVVSVPLGSEIGLLHHARLARLLATYEDRWVTALGRLGYDALYDMAFASEPNFVHSRNALVEDFFTASSRENAEMRARLCVALNRFALNGVEEDTFNHFMGLAREWARVSEPSLALVQAQYWKQCGKIDLAIKRLQELHVRFPAHAQIALYLSDALLLSRQYDEAMQVLDRCGHSSPPFIFLTACALANLGETEEAALRLQHMPASLLYQLSIGNAPYLSVLRPLVEARSLPDNTNPASSSVSQPLSIK